MNQPDIMSGQLCPFCHHKTLTLMQKEEDIPFFGNTYVFSMTCSQCQYHKGDVESSIEHEGSKFSFPVTCEDDLKVRVIKSSTATVKIPHIMSITPGPASNGYVTNIEGIINRAMHVIETQRESEDSNDAKKKAKNLLKKLHKVLWGQETIKIIIEDPKGNSAIISDKALKSLLKK